MEHNLTYSGHAWRLAIHSRKGARHMRLSTTINFFIYPGDGTLAPYIEDMRHYHALGYRVLDAIFCSAAMPGSPLLEDGWRTWAEGIAREAARLGITFTQTHLPYYNFTPSGGGPREDIEEVVRRSIVCTGILGAKWTVSHPATDFQQALTVPASRARNLDYFRPHMALASREGVGLCIENMADFAGQGYRRSYCATVEELCDLVDALQAEYGNAGVCWDFGHANLVYDDQVSCLQYLGERLKMTHVHDNGGQRDEHLTPFRGTVDWPAIMPALTAMGYQGDFSFEIRRMPLAVPRPLHDSLWTHAKHIGEYLLSLA